MLLLLVGRRRLLPVVVLHRSVGLWVMMTTVNFGMRRRRMVMRRSRGSRRRRGGGMFECSRRIVLIRARARARVV